MRFLVDAQLPPGLADWLRRHGHEAEHVAFVLGPRAPDIEIMRYTMTQGAAVVTKDYDFLNLPPPCQSILWVTLGNTTNAALLRAFEPAFETALRLLEGGALVVEIG